MLSPLGGAFLLTILSIDTLYMRKIKESSVKYTKTGSIDLRKKIMKPSFAQRKFFGSALCTPACDSQFENTP